MNTDDDNKANAMKDTYPIRVAFLSSLLFPALLPLRSYRFSVSYSESENFE